MNILLTNDDGYEAQGILTLYKQLRALSFVEHITIVASSCDQSATSHSLSINEPLRVRQINDYTYKVYNGKPADCVYLALHHICKDKDYFPDLVISGINHGCNIGEDVTYSGTVGAAMEATLYDVNSIAISQYYDNKGLNVTSAAKVVTEIVVKIHNTYFPLRNRQLLNINVPNIAFEQIQGYRITRTGHRIYKNNTNLISRINPKGEEYHWFNMNEFEFLANNDELMNDYEAIMQGYVSITPIQIDLTAYKAIHQLKSWIN